MQCELVNIKFSKTPRAISLLLIVTFLVALAPVAALALNPPAQSQSAQPAVKNLLLEPQFPLQGERFFGQVERQDDGKYVLLAGSALYQLDKQLEAAHYDGAKVKVIGTLDPKENTIYVEAFERV